MLIFKEGKKKKGYRWEVDIIYAIASMVSTHAIKALAADAARLSGRQTVRWCIPGNVDAIPAMQAISANGNIHVVTLVPAVKITSASIDRSSTKAWCINDRYDLN